MISRPTIEDSLTLPHIHSIKLVSWFFSRHLGSYPLLSSSGGQSLTEILKFANFPPIKSSTYIYIALFSLNIHIFAIFAGHTALLTGVMPTQNFFFFLICNVYTWKDISEFWQLSPRSLKAHLLSQWGSPCLLGHLQRLLLGAATSGRSP